MPRLHGPGSAGATVARNSKRAWASTARSASQLPRTGACISPSPAAAAAVTSQSQRGQTPKSPIPVPPIPDLAAARWPRAGRAPGVCPPRCPLGVCATGSLSGQLPVRASSGWRLSLPAVHCQPERAWAFGTGRRGSHCEDAAPAAFKSGCDHGVRAWTRALQLVRQYRHASVAIHASEGGVALVRTADAGGTRSRMY